MAESDRYLRQVLFEPLGAEGQERLLKSRAVLIGCGALGSVLANTLVRAGVGALRIIDRDLVEMHNLHRQMLFDEDDVRADLPKAEAARHKLARINSEVSVEAVVDDANHRNITELADGMDMILDATDNFETRFLINDLAVKTNRPWVYGACVGATGMSLVILPRQTPCLQCVFEEMPPPELNPTCETAGILGPVAAMVASRQAMEAIKILAGRLEAVDRRLWTFDVWTGRSRFVDVGKAYQSGECLCCGRGQFEYLQGRHAGRTITLCGRNAVQVFPGRRVEIDLAVLADRLRPACRVAPRFNPLLLKATIDDYELTVFSDGRAVVKGTDRPEEARSVYARYVGS
ncbi:MAG TPA: ThiF family adenylyltransferase [Phycisphaerae bacterium]|nr:ThiF family adenylyltransferase [Phycisphaerae bacterium]